ncbi:MAG TPA: NAD(P)/FAD-dependent oxidoreductase [Thermoleophilaceae bacterium]
MPFVPNRPRSDLAARGADPNAVHWPMVDELFDYDAFLARGPIAEIPSGSTGARIAIVGAGAAGMCAAYELLRAGLRPTVFEASDRIGGRNWSQQFTDGGAPSGVVAELGAMRVPVENKVFYRYFDQFDLTKAPFPDPGLVPTQLYYENTVYDWAVGQDPPGPFKAIKDAFIAFTGQVMNDVDDAYASGDMVALQKAWQALIHRYRNTSFFEAMASGIPSWTTEDLNAFGALGMGGGGFGPLYGVGFLEMLRLLANQLETDQQLIAEGISSITAGMYTAPVQQPDGETVSLESLGCVRPNTPVTGIALEQGTPTVRFAGGAEQFDAVIVATTTRAMEFMGLTTPRAGDPSNVVDGDVKVAIRNLHLMESSKMFIRTETKFWLDANGDPVPGIPQNIQTDELPRGIYCLDYPNTTNGVVCISYTWGDDSAKLLSLSVPQRFAIFKDVVATINPQFAKGLVPVGGDDQILNVDWEAENFYNGAFKLNSPGEEPNVHDAFFQYQSVRGEGDTGVYLAGDSVSWIGGWTEGALHTGLNAACAAAERIGGTVQSPSPLDIDAATYNYG